LGLFVCDDLVDKSELDCVLLFGDSIDSFEFVGFLFEQELSLFFETQRFQQVFYFVSFFFQNSDFSWQLHHHKFFPAKVKGELTYF